MTEKQWVKWQIEKNTVIRLRASAEALDIDFETFINQTLKDGLGLDEPDFFVRQQQNRKREYRSKMIQIWALMEKKPSLQASESPFFELIPHFLVDINFYFRKRNITELGILILSKAQDIMKSLKKDFPEEYEEIKQGMTLHHKTKIYKTLFGELGIPNSETKQLLLDRLDTMSVTGLDSEGNEHSEIYE